jgi:hypothetical protein
MTSTTIRPTTRSSVFERIRPWWLWIVTTFAFPPARWIGDRPFGPVDGLGAGLVVLDA